MDKVKALEMDLKKVDPKVWVIIFMAIAIVILSYIAFKPTPLPYDEKFVREQINAVQHRNDELLKAIAVYQEDKKSDKNKIDSLESLKPKISVVYVEKYKEIDASNVSGVVSEFQNVFSEGNIR